MPIITGKILVQGQDYDTSVSATDVHGYGSTVYVTYIDASGNLKVRATSTVQNVDGTFPIIMSGCSVS